MELLILWGKNTLIVLFGYTLGCFCTGYYLIKLRTGLDLRKLGSGALGSRNAGRVNGSFAFIFTFLNDTAKGATAVITTNVLSENSVWLQMLTLIAVVAGHIWPMQLRFSGGKGIAPAFGAMLIIDYRIMLAAAVVFAMAWIATKQFSLSGLVAVAASPGIAVPAGHSILEISGISFTVLIILYAHRTNLRQIASSILT